jgi:ribosomal protein S14
MIQTAATYGESWINSVERPKELQSAILMQLEKGQISRENTSDARETKECPFCAETILKKAKLCRFCGRELTATED